VAENGPDLSSAAGGRAGSRPATSTDVAKLAGVSQKTVSRVFNDEPHVSEDVRDRVRAAARQLGYRRNLTAAALNSGKTRRIGVVSLGTSLWGPSTLLLDIERAARRSGYGFTVVSSLEGDASGIQAAVDELLTQGVDGIVLSEPIDAEYDLTFVNAHTAGDNFSRRRRPHGIAAREFRCGRDEMGRRPDR
jgi:DNA-binding LacI/PurR family transcriptional regulator